MGAGEPCKGTKEETSSLDGNSAKYLADRWGFPYREAHTLSIDPTVLEILDREESKRLRVLPLEVGPDGPVFAVAEPSEERFAAVRDIAGDNASFVIVAKDTLDALLNSKVFSVSGKPAGGPFRVGRATRLRERGGPFDELRQQETDARRPSRRNEAPRDGPTTTRRRDEHSSYDGTRSATEPAHGQRRTARPRRSTHLLNQIAAGTGNLRAQVDQLTASLETTQRELREANEQLAEATRGNEGHDELVNGPAC